MRGAKSLTRSAVGRTEIDALNGYVVERAAARRITVPAKEALHALVKLREATLGEHGVG